MNRTIQFNENHTECNSRQTQASEDWERPLKAVALIGGAMLREDGAFVTSQGVELFKDADVLPMYIDGGRTLIEKKESGSPFVIHQRCGLTHVFDYDDVTRGWTHTVKRNNGETDFGDYWHLTGFWDLGPIRLRNYGDCEIHQRFYGLNDTNYEIDVFGYRAEIDQAHIKVFFEFATLHIRFECAVSSWLWRVESN